MLELRIKGNAKPYEVLGRIQKAKEKVRVDTFRHSLQVTKLLLIEVAFDDKLIHALGDLLEAGRWERVQFRRCSGPIRKAIDSIAKSHVDEFHFSDHADHMDEVTHCHPTNFPIVLSNSNLMRVMFANLSLSKENGIALSRALAENTTLQSFCLSGSQLDDEAVGALAVGFKSNSNLKVIQISDCGLVDENICCIAENLEENWMLQRLALDGNHCQSKGFKAISKLLQRNANSGEKSIEEIDMSNQQGTELPTNPNNSYVSEFLLSLKSSPGLKSVVMKNCNIRDEDMHSVVDLLSSNASLENVDLQFNNLSPLVIKSKFAPNLPRMKNVKRLLIRQGNGALDESVRDCLVQGLAGNWALESLDLFDWESRVLFYLDLNRSGRKVLKDFEFPLGLWPLVLERSTKAVHSSSASSHFQGKRQQRKIAMRNASVLYHFLRNSPMLQR